MRLTLGRKLGLSFGVILALMIVSSIMSYVTVKDSQAKEEFLINVRVATIINCRKASRLYGIQISSLHSCWSSASKKRSSVESVQCGLGKRRERGRGAYRGLAALVVAGESGPARAP